MKVLYPLQPKQREFIMDMHKLRLFGGAKGGGKSYGVRADLVGQCMRSPGLRCLALRRTFPEIEENMIQPLMRELPRNMYTYNSQRHTMYFRNGASIRFSFCHRADDVYKYQGLEYDVIAIEELTQWKEWEFDTIMTSLRSTRYATSGIFTCNPGGRGHNWVKRRWISRNFLQNEDGTWKEDPDDYSFIPATVYDNKVLMENDPSYLQRLRSLPDAKRRAYLDGDWDAFEGQYFDWTTKNVIEPLGQFTPRRLRLGIDWGSRAPAAAVWIAEIGENDFVIYRELYETGHTYRSFAEKIARMMSPAEKAAIRAVVDPSAYNKSPENTDLGQYLRGVGIVNYAGNNNRLQGWDLMKYLIPPSLFPDGTMRPRLRATKECRNFNRTMPELIYDEHAVEDLDSDGEDHAADAARYGLVDLGNVSSVASWVKQANDALARGTKRSTL